MRRHARPLAGKALKASGLLKHFGKADFLLVFEKETWDHLTPEQRTALVDHELCFPAGTQVAGPKPEAALARWYAGHLVEIRTASGNFLSGTPNHPVLTSRGWVPLGLLKEGDDVVRCGLPERVAATVDPDEHQIPAGIEQVAGSGLVSLRSVPEPPQNFDPEPATCQVEIVGADGNLLAALYPPRNQHFSEPNLGRRDGVAVLVARAGHLGERFWGMALAAPSRVGDPNILLGVADDGGAIALAVAPIPGPDPSLHQDPRDDSAGDAQLLFERIRRGPGDVSLDQIVGVEVRSFRGHVFNLQTRGAWYIANGIVTHNCHCAVKHTKAGEPRWFIQGHDLEEFRAVIERHGLWQPDVVDFGRVVQEVLPLQART